jgi:hypothetical protein
MKSVPFLREMDDETTPHTKCRSGEIPTRRRLNGRSSSGPFSMRYRKRRAGPAPINGARCRLSHLAPTRVRDRDAFSEADKRLYVLLSIFEDVIGRLPSIWLSKYDNGGPAEAEGGFLLTPLKRNIERVNLRNPTD